MCRADRPRGTTRPDGARAELKVVESLAVRRPDTERSVRALIELLALADEDDAARLMISTAEPRAA